MDKMILGMGLTSGYGNHPGAWRAPGVDPANYAKVEANIRYAQSAERGGFSFLFTPDFPALRGDVEHAPIVARAALPSALRPRFVRRSRNASAAVTRRSMPLSRTVTI